MPRRKRLERETSEVDRRCIFCGEPKQFRDLETGELWRDPCLCDLNLKEDEKNEK